MALYSFYSGGHAWMRRYGAEATTPTIGGRRAALLRFSHRPCQTFGEPARASTAMVTGSFGPGMRKGILNQVFGINDMARQLKRIFPQSGQCSTDISFR
jgi:hypothetical protein